jgi:hypothetical protein
MWPSTIVAILQGNVPDGMVTFLWLGIWLVLFQLQKTIKLLKATSKPSARKRLKFILGCVLLVLLSNVIANGALLHMLFTGEISLTRNDQTNIMLSFSAVVLIAAADWSYDRWRSATNREFSGLENYSFRATLVLCGMALFTRIEPGLMLAVSDSLVLLSLGMPAGYFLISLQRCAMTGLEYNQAVVNHRLNPSSQADTAQREAGWLMRTDGLNALTAASVLGAWCLSGINL